MSKKPFILLEFPHLQKQKKCLFDNFKDILTFKQGDNLDSFFNSIENYLDKGFWASGYFTYEFGLYLEKKLSHIKKNSSQTLAWIGISNKPTDVKKKSDNSKQKSFSLLKRGHSISFKKHEQAIKQIKNHLTKGNSYQVNFTFKANYIFKGNPYKLYLKLKENQKTDYSAFIQTQNHSILSLSPELFFNIEKNKLLCKPMKGTIKKSNDEKLDKKNKKILSSCEKNRAENLMIVDLLRNDMGKISTNIKASKLFKIETYQTLHQMTSSIESKLKKNLSIKKIFQSLYPCGSITGAPKIETMNIIDSLEKQMRGIYTGAIGYISPAREFCFNVPIRTLVLNKNNASLGIGGGIVYDSVAKEEYEEAILKSKFVSNLTSNFSLIETIKWEKKNSYILLDEHIKRIKKSLRFFKISFSTEKLKKQLKTIQANFKSKHKIIRVLISNNGNLKITQHDFVLNKKNNVKITLSPKKTDKSDPLLYHKTTIRDFYNKERKKLLKTDIYETIFCNQEDEITEGTISNVFIKHKNKLYTPSLKCGLLPGVLRQNLLDNKKVIEKKIYLEDLLTADQIYIGNSVRGLIKAKLVDK